jgi:hypothetical protein
MGYRKHATNDIQYARAGETYTTVLSRSREISDRASSLPIVPDSISLACIPKLHHKSDLDLGYLGKGRRSMGDKSPRVLR